MSAPAARAAAARGADRSIRWKKRCWRKSAGKSHADFGLNAFFGSVMGSVGALAAGVPQWLQERWGWDSLASYKSLFILTIVFSVGLLLVYSAIDERHQPRLAQKKMSKASGVFVTKMSILAFVDNFGAGMAGGLLSYWFFLRSGVELKSLGMLFSISNFLAALSFLSAPIIARRIGL